MATINTWINFNGNAEEAFMFYKSVFGGKFAKITRFKDLAGPEFPVAENVMFWFKPPNESEFLLLLL